MSREPESCRSWADTLRVYEKVVRNHKVPKQKVRDPIIPVSTLNPVLQTFLDPEKEKATLVKEQQEKLWTTNQGRDRQLHRQAKYDIVNNTSLDTGDPLKSNKTDNLGIRKRNFCILSNKDINQRGHFTTNQKRNRNYKNRTISEKTKREFRNFDILKNKYVKNHEQKIQIEKEFEKKLKCSQYLQEYDFDPVLGKYVNPVKENTISRKEYGVEKNQYSQALENRPTWQKFSEGSCQDIVTGLRKSENIPPVDKKTQRHLRTYSKRYQQHQKWKNQCKSDEKIIQKLIINRKTTNRYETGALKENNATGYNIINNKPFVGRVGVPPHKPYAKNPDNLWKSTFSSSHNRLKTDTEQLHRFDLFDSTRTPF